MEIARRVRSRGIKVIPQIAQHVCRQIFSATHGGSADSYGFELRFRWRFGSRSYTAVYHFRVAAEFSHECGGKFLPKHH